MYPIYVNLAASWLLEKIAEKVVQDITGTGLQKVGIFNVTCKRCNTRQQRLAIPEKTPFQLTCQNEECRYSCEVFIENLSSMTIHYVEEMQVLAKQVNIVTYPSEKNNREQISKFFRNFFNNSRNRKWAASILSFVFMLMTWTLYLYLSTDQSTLFENVVTTKELNLRDGPGTEYSILSAIPLSATVKLLAKEPYGQWLQIKTDSGEMGWIYAKYITTTVEMAQVPISTNIPSFQLLDTITNVPTSNNLGKISIADLSDSKNTSVYGIIQIISPQNNSLINSKDLLIEWIWISKLEGNCMSLPEGYGFEIRIGTQGIMNAVKEQDDIKCDPKTGIYSYLVGDIYTAVANKPKPYNWNVALIRFNPYNPITESKAFILQID